MSFGDHAVLWLHITAAVFTIGPGTAAIMSTPRQIRRRNPAVVGYLLRTTRVYTIASLLVLIFGIALTSQTHKWNQWWIIVALTLFVVAFVLLVLIMRDQRKALRALEAMESAVAGDGGEIPTIRSSVEGQVPVVTETAATGSGTTEPAPAESGAEAAPAAEPPADQAAAGNPARPSVTVAAEVRLAAVERGRIASFGGVTALIWLVILVLMVWH